MDGLAIALDILTTTPAVFAALAGVAWGIVGGAVATVAAASAAAIASFAIGFSLFGLTLPLSHLIRIAIATIAMGAVLNALPDAANFVGLAAHIAAGAATYMTVLALLYTPWMFKLRRAPPQQSES